LTPPGASFMLEGRGLLGTVQGHLMAPSISAEILARRSRPAAAGPATAFLVLDTESVPDGRLLHQVKYPDEELTPEQAVARAQEEARANSRDGSDFLPVTFQYPVAVCVLRVGSDFALQGLKCLDAPHFRPAEIVRQFWQGVGHYRPKLVTFNGRGFDLPLLELGAFRYGCSAREHFYNSRNRYNGNHLDLFDWLSNYGACRLAGGLDLLSKLLGKPGKMGVAGDQVYSMYLAGKLQEINDYCLCDTLDTYFVFLRSRVLSGDLTPEQEAAAVRQAKAWLAGKAEEFPVLLQYLVHWRDGEPWP
ncbi:MAG TPA: 3'-5' exonuclease, partial [Gemmataceae bacterium]|nr:3'-5' exonuclease [Gemmataceae bacterium]